MATKKAGARRSRPKRKTGSRSGRKALASVKASQDQSDLGAADARITYASMSAPRKVRFQTDEQKHLSTYTVDGNADVSVGESFAFGGVSWQVISCDDAPGYTTVTLKRGGAATKKDRVYIAPLRRRPTPDEAARATR